MSDLCPGMTIEVSTTLTDSLHPDRPSWLHHSAMWPPEPGKVMYMISETSTGICDECILTSEDEISRLISESRHGSLMVRERGHTSWYCSMHPNGNFCERHWDGYRYKDRRR